MNVFLSSRVLGCCGLLVISGCQEDVKPKAKPAPQVSAPKPPASPKQEKPWYVASWEGSGEIQAGANAMTVDQAHRQGESALNEEATSIKVQLKVAVDETREASGSASFGEDQAALVGILDERVLRLKVRGEVWQGALVATSGRPGDPFQGTLRVSSTSFQRGKSSTQLASGDIQLELAK